MHENLPISKTREHLNLNIKGAKPIIACVGSFDDYRKSKQAPREEIYRGKLFEEVHNVDYGDLPEDCENKSFLNAGEKTYFISTIDEGNKFSERLYDCTALIVAGIDKETGKNISFLTHQDPVKFLLNKKDDFIKHLGQRLDEIKKRCVPGTIDAVIVGGAYFDGNDNKGLSNKKKYLDSIELLSLETKQILGFDPSVINGPKKVSLEGYGDGVYYDNKNRGLYFVRREVNEDTGSFTQSDIEKEKTKWE